MDQMIETERKVLASGIEINYLANEFLFRQGQKAEFVFYFQGGEISLKSFNSPEGIIYHANPVFLGIKEVLEGQKHTFSAETLQTSKFLVFEKNYFLMLMQEFDFASSYFEQKSKEFDAVFTELVPH
ncbi:Crp/Fnr family transcriptional regulator [Cytophagaceae bacterium 50C-KIRBA]|uniref:Crp/Fnr family transcriptional regulator n=1 Tax=Aquirufa beregesia TaxID=2516556 RepID=A0ABX0ETB6_9BACT|nr:cyclic nucleotide-binding domain-containing protein [Aquirufa beregesia]NGZ43283.1 Crp/Fnr family transcriptional regulator [Aquirufa beregesia]